MSDSATILLVEDDLPLLDGIADLLEVSDIGYSLQVIKTTDGEEGLQAVTDYEPDLVISDIMMPRMGGFEFLERLRSQKPFVHIPVIFLTARGTPTDVLRGRLSGVELYLTKPYDSDELLQMVRSQLDRAIQLQGDRQRRLQSLSHNIVKLLNHEFRTPLTYVTAYYELLADGILHEDPESLREYLRGIQVGAGRLSQLVGNLIRLLSLRTGQAAEEIRERSEFIDDLDRLLLGMCGPRKGLEPEQVADVRCHLPHFLPPIFGHRDSLYAILDCLIDNAVKFSFMKPDNIPNIVVSAKARSNDVWISVVDNGIGVPEDAHERIFDLFYQHDREVLEQQGAGAGLAIVDGLAKLHGGRVEVSSMPGKGSKFSLIVPIRRSSLESPAPAPVEKIPATILLVEDEWYLLEGLRDLLGVFDSPYELSVLTANDGEHGLEVLAECKPDLIITDIMMPQMDGYEFLREVRKNPAWVHIPVIFLTAKGDRKDILLGRSIGAEEYITKPYEVNQLFSLISAQLDRYFQRKNAIESDFEELKRNVLELLMSDMNMPLGVVSEYSDRMVVNLDRIQSEEDLLIYLEAIEKGSLNVSRLISDFMMLVELRTGQATNWYSLQTHPTDINDVVEQVFLMTQSMSGQHKLVLERDLSWDIGKVMIDPELMIKCMNRLITLIITLCQTCPEIDIKFETHARGAETELVLSTRSLGLTGQEVSEVNVLLARPETFVLELSQYDPALLLAKGVVHYHGGRISIEKHGAQGFSIVIQLPVYQSANGTSG
jgi:DNA-binding response OmpR family regulator